MTYRGKNKIGICFAALMGVCLFIFFELLPGFAHAADVPQTVNTGSIVFTDLRFEPKSVRTGSIVFTGLRFEPKSVKTGSIVFTGLRFEPKSVKTGSILFTGLGQETTLGPSGSKASLGRKGQKEADVSKAGKFDTRTVKPRGNEKTMPKEAPTGFVPPSRKKIKKDAGKETTKTARVSPGKLGARLVLKDHNIIKSMRLKVNESFDLVLFVSNTGDTKSGPLQYAITCKVLRGGPKCPVPNMTRMAPNIAAQKTYEINLNGIAAFPGEYELSVELKTGRFQSSAIKRIRLQVETANRSIMPMKDTGTQQNKDKSRIKQTSPIRPKQGKSSNKYP